MLRDVSQVNAVAITILVLVLLSVTLIAPARHGRVLPDTLIFRTVRLPAGTDETLPANYTANPVEGPAAVAPAPAATGVP
jgi:hypothetical protein